MTNPAVHLPPSLLSNAARLRAAAIAVLSAYVMVAALDGLAFAFVDWQDR